MTADVLAFMTPGPMELIVIWWFALVFMAVPVVLIVLLVLYLSKSSKERHKLQMKMDELSEDLKKTQEQLKGRGESSDKST